MTRVLLIESDEGLRNLYRRALVEDGYELMDAADFTEALAKNLLGRPDIVVMDPATPRGLETARELARVNPRAIIVFHTSVPENFTRDFSAWVADALAEKGADPHRLRSALRCLVAGSASPPGEGSAA